MAIYNAMYSIFILNNAIVLYFLLNQLLTVFLRVKTYPNIDFLDFKSPIQSESKYSINNFKFSKK